MTVDPEAFDMAEYYQFGKGIWPLTSLLRDSLLIRYECGTIACAVGHGPGAGIMPTLADETWPNYAERVFGAFSDPAEDILVHAWCFDGIWSEHDNTPEGAAKRIIYMLDHGGVPSVGNEKKAMLLYAAVVVPLPELEQDEAA
jgi:hypothetical protein